MKEVIKADSLHRLNMQVTEFVENHLSMADELTIVTTIKDGEYVATVMPKDTRNAIMDMLGGATGMAIKIKEKLVEMAIEDEIPSDMNELDYSIISDIIEQNLTPER